MSIISGTRNAKYYAEHHEERMAYHAKYRAEHREEIKASCERYARKYPEAKRISTAKYNATHREAVRARNAKYAAENPEKLKRMKLNYQNSERGRNAHIASEHRRRMNGASPLETDLIEELKEEYGGFCPYCNKWINNGHIDHIFPISRSGTNERNNLVFVCAPCNLNKSNKNLLEFMIFRRLSTEVQNATI